MEKDETLTHLTEEVAGLEARRTAASRQLEEVRARREQLQIRADMLVSEREKLAQDISAVAELGEAEEAVVLAEAALDEAKAQSDAGSQRMQDVLDSYLAYQSNWAKNTNYLVRDTAE